MIATKKDTVLESLPVDPAMLESANRWFDISWYGLLVAGGATAIAAVATGVFLYFQWWSSNVRERHSEWRTAAVESETVLAKKDTALAHVRIAELNKETARLSAEAETARASIAGANERAARAEQRAAEAKLDLERFKAPRTITPAQAFEFVAKFKQFSGQKYSFNIFHDPEAIALKRMIDAMLNAAGWVLIPSQIGDVLVDGHGSSLNSGIQIGIPYKSPQPLQDLALSLTAFFSNAEMTAVTGFIPNLTIDNAININVGKKP